jgi:hypothetical protein
MNYKAHLFATIGNGKYHPTRTECGRHLHRNNRGTHVVKMEYFKSIYEEDPNSVCEKCLKIIQK